MPAWRFLGIPKLQQEIGPEQLAFVEECASKLGEDIDVSHAGHLGRIADSFISENFLKKKENRAYLYDQLSCQYAKRLDEVFEGVKADGAVGTVEAHETGRSAFCEWPVKRDEYWIRVCAALRISDRFLPSEKKETPRVVGFHPDQGWQLEGLVRKPFKQLKGYQFNKAEEALRRLSNSHARLLLVMPTGTGKTRTACEIVSHFLNSQEDGKSRRVLWLAERTELIEQATLAFRETWGHLGNRALTSIQAAQESDLGEENLNRAPCTIVFATAQRLKTAAFDRNRAKFHPDLIVFDEAHRIVAPTYAKLVEEFLSTSTSTLGPRPALLGLTATEGRGDGSEQQSEPLAEFFHTHVLKLEPPIGTDLSLMRWLEREGFLSKAIYHRIEGVELPNLQSADDGQQDFSQKVLTEASKSLERTARVVELVRRLHDVPENRIMLFAPSVAASKNIVAMLHFIGIPSGHIDGSLSEVTRADTIDKFRNAKIRVLSNYSVLAEGFDVPGINCLIIARPTTSLVLYSQMLGRGLRGPALGGTKRCDVYQVEDNFDNLPSADRISEMFERFWF